MFCVSGLNVQENFVQENFICLFNLATLVKDWPHFEHRKLEMNFEEFELDVSDLLRHDLTLFL